MWPEKQDQGFTVGDKRPNCVFELPCNSPLEVQTLNLEELIYFQLRYDCFHRHKKTHQSCSNYTGVVQQLGNHPADTPSNTLAKYTNREINQLHSFRMDRRFVIPYITANYSLGKSSVSKTTSAVEDNRESITL